MKYSETADVKRGGMCYTYVYIFIEGSLEAKLPTAWTDGKALQLRQKLRHGESQMREDALRHGESQKREDAGARQGRKVGKHCVFPMFCGSGGSKSRLAKAAGAEPAGQMRDEKFHAVVARSTFRSKKWQNTRGSDHFWKFRSPKTCNHLGMPRILSTITVVTSQSGHHESFNKSMVIYGNFLG